MWRVTILILDLRLENHIEIQQEIITFDFS
jgi:hypothetical protein